MSEDYKRVLEQQLWNIANTLRGKMNADEFRDYILGFIFYKYLSEKMNIFADEILKQDNVKFRDITPKTENGKEFIEAIKEEALEKLGYFLRPEELFTEVAKRGKGDNEDDIDKFDETKTKFILEDLQKILINIQLSTMGTDSEEDYENLFEDMDLNSSKLGKTPEARNAIIAKVLTHLDKIDFKLNDIKGVDVLGDAYEYLIGQFASGAGKKAGEFYTPQEVSKVLAKIVTTGKTKLKSVYDPTCGSGSLLLRVAREVEDVSNFYGQEMNRTTYNLARMNMILHGVHYRKFDIKQDDTLEHPQHIDKQFEAIVANPPFSAQWSANPLFTSDDRFSQYGRLAPSRKADFAFVQHMIYHLADNGTMAIVLPHGALFRGGAEQHIRRYLIDNKNFLDAVIGLPTNIFYGTSIPTCILVFKKCRENPEDILFIDASNSFNRIKTQNILRESDIEKISNTYSLRLEEEKYSKKISLKTIEARGFNLNILNYIDNSDVIENVDLVAVTKNLSITKEKSQANDLIIKTNCEELEIPFPDGNNLLLLKKFKKGVMQKIFNQEISFKSTLGNDYPIWETKNLGEVANFRRGSFPQPYGLPEWYDDVNGFPFIQVFDVDDNMLLKETTKNKISLLAAEQSVFVENGTLVITIQGSIGRIAKTQYDAYIDRTLLIFQSYKIPINIDYFKYVVFLLFEIEKTKAPGGIIKTITKEVLTDFEIQIPCLEEQNKIATFLTAIDEKIYLVEY